MTKEDAIKYLKQLYPNGGHCWLDEQRIEAIGMAVNALQEEPKSKCAGCNNVKGCVTCVDGSEWAHYEEPVSGLDNGNMPIERWKKAVEAASNQRNYRCSKGLTETRDDYFVDGVQWADEHPKEEPVSEELEEAAKKYSIASCEGHMVDDLAVVNFKAGAKWQEKKDQDAVEIAREEMIEKMQDWIADTFKYDGSEDFNGGDNDAMSMLLDDFTEYIKGQ